MKAKSAISALTLAVLMLGATSMTYAQNAQNPNLPVSQVSESRLNTVKSHLKTAMALRLSAICIYRKNAMESCLPLPLAVLSVR